MPQQSKQESYNFIDLFAGAGGLSEGFLQAGFKPVAHVEMNKFAAKTLETRNAYYYLKGTNNLDVYKQYLNGIQNLQKLLLMLLLMISLETCRNCILEKAPTDMEVPRHQNMLRSTASEQMAIF